MFYDDHDYQFLLIINYLTNFINNITYINLKKKKHEPKSKIQLQG